MRNVGRWFPISLVLVLGGVSALLFAAPAFEASTLSALADNDPQVRATAVSTLASEGAMSDLLYELGQDHTPLQKAGLAEAIRRKGVTSGEVGTLKTLLQSADVSTRHLAAGLLAPVAASAWQDLAARATDSNEVVLVRATAATALAGGGAQTRGTLMGLAHDEEVVATVRYAAIRSLVALSPSGPDDARALAADPDRAWGDRAQAIRALVDAGPEGEPALVSLTTSKEVAVRQEAVAALVARGNAGVSSTLAGLLTDRSADVRYVALQGLEILGATKPHATAVLGRLLDLTPRVQALAARLAGTVGATAKTTVIPTLKGLLASASFRVRYEAALALRALGDRSGAPTMLADQATTNAAQKQMAAQAYATIQA